MSVSKSKFAALDESIAQMAKQAKVSSEIYARMWELMSKNGLVYGYSQEKALEEATLEVTGKPAR